MYVRRDGGLGVHLIRDYMRSVLAGAVAIRATFVFRLC